MISVDKIRENDGKPAHGNETRTKPKDQKRKPR